MPPAMRQLTLIAYICILCMGISARESFSDSYSSAMASHVVTDEVKLVSTKANPKYSSFISTKSRLVSAFYFPIAVRWSLNLKQGSSATNYAGSSYVLPLQKTNIGEQAVVLYDVGKKDGVSHIESTLKAMKGYIEGIIISHLDDDHSGGLEAFTSNLLQQITFFVTAMPGNLETAQKLSEIIKGLNQKLPQNTCLIFKEGDNRANQILIARKTKGQIIVQKSDLSSKLMAYFAVEFAARCPTYDTSFTHLYTGLERNKGSIMAGFKVSLDPNNVYTYFFTGDAYAADIIADARFTLSGLLPFSTPAKWDMMEIPHHGSWLSATTLADHRPSGEHIDDISTQLLSISKGFFVSSAGTPHHLHNIVMAAQRRKMTESYVQAYVANPAENAIPALLIAFPTQQVNSVTPGDLGRRFTIDFELINWMPNVLVMFDQDSKAYHHMLPLIKTDQDCKKKNIHTLFGQQHHLIGTQATQATFPQDYDYQSTKMMNVFHEVVARQQFCLEVLKTCKAIRPRKPNCNIFE